MTYSWCNKKRLETLSAEGENNVLKFQSPGEECLVHLQGGDIAKVIFAAKDKPAVEIAAKNAKAYVIGEGNATRDVIHFLAPGGPAPTMRAGITHHRGTGTWSSLPHDFELNTEPGFEEVFFYILKGQPMRALQLGRGVWFDNSKVDDIWPIAHETFGTVPMGYHPVVGEPGVHVSYVWVYLAKHARWEKVK
jgi:5-deoxy-D-glucuronate isomerase